VTAHGPEDESGAERWLPELAGEFTDIGRELRAAETSGEVLNTLTRIAAQRVPGAEFAGITVSEKQGFRSVAPTSDLVQQVDDIQYRERTGPCVDAVVKAASSVVDDLRHDERWHAFGSQAFEATGIRSMLSFRLFLEDEPGIRAALNCYSRNEAAFDDASTTIALLLATHGALALSAALANERASNLEKALTNSRDIGVALGVLMSAYKVTRDQAFDLLRMASQQSQRKLADLALEVGDTGALPNLPRRPPRRPTAYNGDGEQRS
jgi:hypothetical protein